MVDIITKLTAENAPSIPTSCALHDAADTGLESESADAVIGEAMLTMQTERGKRAIIAEAYRLLRAGGTYSIHELGLQPDDLPEPVKDEVRKIGSSDEIKTAWAKNGAEYGKLSQQQFAAMVRAEIQRWAQVVKASGARLE